MCAQSQSPTGTGRGDAGGAYWDEVTERGGMMNRVEGRMEGLEEG